MHSVFTRLQRVGHKERGDQIIDPHFRTKTSEKTEEMQKKDLRSPKSLSTVKTDTEIKGKTGKAEERTMGSCKLLLPLIGDTRTTESVEDHNYLLDKPVGPTKEPAGDTVNPLDDVPITGLRSGTKN